MRKLLFILLFVSTICLGQNNKLLWVTQFTGVGQNQPVSVITDNSGCSYVYGNFTTTVNQDALTLTCSGPQDIFLAKYNKSGQVLWLKQFGGTGSETAITIALSNDGNYIYFSGFSNSNPCMFDGNSLATTGLNDIFLAKYAIDGTFQWVKDIAYGANQQNFGNFAIDQNNNIILTGQFLTDVTFYGGGTTLTSALPAIRQSFMSKFDQDGNLIWAKMLSGDNASTTIRAVGADNSGYYISGMYSGNFTLDIGVITSVGGSDGFLYKTDFDGNGQWVRKIKGTGDDYIWRHKPDANGYQFLIGYYNSPTLTVDSTATLASVLTFPNAGSNDIFYACYAPDGTLQFARRYGTAGDDQGLGVYPNANHVVIGGQYTGSINFGAFNLTNSSTDAYMVELDKTGTVLSAKKAFGTNVDVTRTCNITSDGTDIFCGDFKSATLNIDGRILTDASGGLTDMFLCKYVSDKVVLTSGTKAIKFGTKEIRFK